VVSSRLDPEEERQRLGHSYSEMLDAQIEELAATAETPTDSAREALWAEISRRNLDVVCRPTDPGRRPHSAIPRQDPALSRSPARRTCRGRTRSRGKRILSLGRKRGSHGLILVLCSRRRQTAGPSKGHIFIEGSIPSSQKWSLLVSCRPACLFCGSSAGGLVNHPGRRSGKRLGLN
jgi:hypothetical protein